MLIICLFWSSPAGAVWDSGDTTRQWVLTGLICVDWLQTQEIVKDPDNRTELNPLLGEHPSMSKINVLIPLSIIACYLTARVLPEGWRPWFQWAVIIIESLAIYNNHARGIRVVF
jgi:hypothetical protein